MPHRTKGGLRPTHQPFATVTHPSEPKILNILAKMENDGKSKYSTHFTAKALSFLAKHGNLENPEGVKQFIASLQSSNGYKRNLSIAYNKYCKHYGLTWQMPLYKPEAKRIRIPTKEKLEMLIANARPPTSVKLQISMETGLRPVELCRLCVRDVDLDKRTVYPTTAKHGSARELRIANSLTEMLREHIAKHNLSPNDRLFKGTADDYGKHYRAMRNKLAKKLHDASIQTIRLYDFRHYFATATYHKTKDILYTKQQMGHTKIETTLIYAQLLDVNDDEWTCRTAKTAEDAAKLIEAGFDYVTEMDGARLFRKRK